LVQTFDVKSIWIKVFSQMQQIS